MREFKLAGGQIVDGKRGVLLDARGPVQLERGVKHDHRPLGGPPSGRWEAAVSWRQTIPVPVAIPLVGPAFLLDPDIANQFFLYTIVQGFWSFHGRNITPAELMDIVANPLVEPGWMSQALSAATLGLIRRPNGIGPFVDKPIALEHLNFFLSGGHGQHLFDERDYLERLLNEDTGVQRLLRAHMARQPKIDGTIEGKVKVEQSDYSIDDFAYAFGAIDHLSYRADLAQGTLQAWFIDCYEWHPCYYAIPDMYPVQHSDDVERPTNVLHAACVELKAGVARDFWMMGMATVPLDVVSPP